MGAYLNINKNICYPKEIQLLSNKNGLGSTYKPKKPQVILSFGKNLPTVLISKSSLKIPNETLELINDIESRGLKLGQGWSGTAYRLDIPGYQPLAVKVPYSNWYTGKRKRGLGIDYTNEARILQKLPSEFELQFNSLVQETRPEGRKFLVMTYVNGDPIHPLKNPLTKAHLDSIVDIDYRLDRAGIYHRDQGSTNLLASSAKAENPGKINLIDYEGASVFTPQESIKHNGLFDPYHQYFPSFCFIQNVTNFQSNGLPTLLGDILLVKGFNKNSKNEVKDLFKYFLQAKAKQLKKQIEYLKANLNETNNNSPLRYAELQSQYFENVSDDLLLLEAWKTQAMYYTGMARIVLQCAPEYKQVSTDLQKKALLCSKKAISIAKKSLRQLNQQDNHLKELLQFESSYNYFLFQNIQKILKIDSPTESKLISSEYTPLSDFIKSFPSLSPIQVNIAACIESICRPV